MNSVKQQVQNKNNDNNSKSKSRHHIVISDKNYFILKKIGYTSMSMNDVITKILSKQLGIYRIELEEEEESKEQEKEEELIHKI